MSTAADSRVALLRSLPSRGRRACSPRSGTRRWWPCAACPIP